MLGPMSHHPLLFDLDGTLLDTLGDLADAANAARGAFGLAPLADERVAPHIGWGLGHLLSNVLPPAQLQHLAAARKIFMAYYAGHLLVRSRPCPGAEALMARRGGRFMGLVTNKPLRFVTPILEALQWQFDVVVAGDTLSARKPDPAPVRHALAGVVGAEGAWFIGDSEVDLAAAKAAGVDFLGVSWGRVAQLGVPCIDRLDAALERRRAPRC